MDVLILAQTVFYFTFSLLLIVVFISAILVGYYLIHIAKNLNKLSDNLNQTSEEVKENIKEIIERISSLPFLSFFLKKSGEKLISKKGRGK